MSTRNWLILGIGGLILALGMAFLQKVPGYMDAEYYYAGGLRIASNHAASEPFLWNYLDDPTGLPHPSFSYWMPLPAMLAALGMKITGSNSFTAARIFFILLCGLIPILTAWLVLRMGGTNRQAMLAGGFGIFPGFYALYTGLTESFTPAMLLGAGMLLTLSSDWTMWKRGLAAGILAGLMHLNRADGMLWVGAGLLWFFLEWRRLRPVISWRQVLGGMALSVVAYFAIMSPWFLRNLQTWGSLMPPGGSRTLWLTDYNQTFLYPAGQLSFSTWLSTGLGSILKARLDALWLNLKTLLAVQGAVILLPLVLVGIWRLRKNLVIQVGGFMWLVYFLVMTLVFPFSGSRGGFFHSGAAVQPMLWGAAAVGFSAIIDWGSQKRGWSKAQAWRVFSAGLVIILAVMTGFLAWERTLRTDPGMDNWSAGAERYHAVETWLRSQGGEGSIVMVNNPPGYYVAGQRAAIVIPLGEVDTVLEVARKFGAEYLVLEQNTTPQLKDLYQSPRSLPGLIYLTTVDGAEIFRFDVK